MFDEFGELGRAYRETDEAEADERTIIENILRSEYSEPLRVVAFNTAKGFARDVSEDIAHAVGKQATSEGRELSDGTRAFLEIYLANVSDE